MVAMVMAQSTFLYPGSYYLFITMSVIETLLRASIDYAGLFPPAGLDMDTAVANFARYRASPVAWALGRFIVPVGRLSEFEAAARQHPVPAPGGPWLLGALAGLDPRSDLEQLRQFNLRHGASSAPVFTADTFEVKATSNSAIEEILRRAPADLQAYVEIPIDRDPSDLIATIGRLGGRAKVRTGGVTPEAFPHTADLVRFIRECILAGVPFKATAGLHHPLRAEYRLTYAPDSPRATMFGFLNLFLASAFLRAGMHEVDAVRLLEENSPEALRVDDGGISWRDYRLDLKSLSEDRTSGMISFGSCSFTEPIADLQSLHLLEPRAQRA
jgi:hypothetical protein